MLVHYQIGIDARSRLFDMLEKDILTTGKHDPR